MDPALRLDGVGIEKGWSRNGVGLEHVCTQMLLFLQIKIQICLSITLNLNKMNEK